MKRCGIYLLTHRESGRQYVGQSINIDARLAQHAGGKSGSGIVGAAIAKHGWSAFDTRVLEFCPRDGLDAAEKRWIDALGSMSPAGFNLTDGGQKYKQVTDDVRAKISEATRRGLTPEVVAQRAAKLRGRPKSPEHRAKLAANLARAREAGAAMGRAPISEETREKLAASKRGKRMSEETKKKVSDAKKAKHVAERAAGIVRSHTDETKAKQAAARRAWYGRNPTFKRPRTAEGRFA